MDYAVALARIGIGLLFLTVGFAKVRAGQPRFVQAVMAYDLVPLRWGRFIARVLPWIEIGVGIALLLGVAPVASALIAFVLLIIVSGAVLRSLVLGRVHHCGCVGFTWDRVQTVQWALCYRNAWLAAALVFDIHAQGGRWRACEWTASCTVLVPAASWLTAGCAIALLLSMITVLHFRRRLRAATATPRPEPFHPPAVVGR